MSGEGISLPPHPLSPALSLPPPSPPGSTREPLSRLPAPIVQGQSLNSLKHTPAQFPNFSVYPDSASFPVDSLKTNDTHGTSTPRGSDNGTNSIVLGGIAKESRIVSVGSYQMKTIFLNQ